MAKRQPTKRPVRPRKTEAALPAETSVPIPVPAESAPIVTQPENGSKQPERGGSLTLFLFTLVAALLGVALGYYLGAKSSDDGLSDDASQAAAQPATMDREREREVLVLLQDELVENARILKQQRELRQGGNVDPSVRFQFVKNDLWRAVVNGRDVQAIQDLSLLNTIATAYRYIDEIRLLERRSVEIGTVTGRFVPGIREQQAATLASLGKLAPLAEKSILEAAVQLDQNLKAKQ